MEKSGKSTFCCGAGGGRMWMEETRGTRINAERTRQALETGASTVATACPFCMTMLKDGLSDAQSGVASSAEPGAGVVSARDIAEILADVVIPEPVDPRRALPSCSRPANRAQVGGQPGSGRRQLTQVLSVQALYIPQLGQRFWPSVDTAYGLSCCRAWRSRRWRRTMNIVATTPIAAAAISRSSSCVRFIPDPRRLERAPGRRSPLPKPTARHPARVGR
jgi:hypothetical protein